MEPNALVMAPTEGEVWLPGRFQSQTGAKFKILLESGKEEIVDQNSVVAISEKSLQSADDMTKLEQLHESLILHNLRSRFQQGVIYTYIGPMVVSINPYRVIDDYGEHLIPEYRTKDKDLLKPHLYAVAQKAYKSMVDFGDSQSVIISGESGAGKTEATKIVLKFLTVAAGSKSDIDVASKILATNPILEAFGNSKTTRNNNSSRFGKFIKIVFSGGKISGAQIENYLLEKTRVVYQAPTERNFHIFYQIIAGTTPEQKEKYMIRPNISDYHYLTNGDIRVEGIDDKVWWQYTEKSFKVLGFSDQEIDELMQVLSGILLLGNVEFEGEDEVNIKDPDLLQDLCKCLGLLEGVMKRALTVREFSAGARGSAYKVPLNKVQAIENRDALSKTLYFKLFSWLVTRLNESLKSGGDDSDVNDPKSKFIGVLDIYGFEIFDKNSLEQFCINYANEKLHQQFNHHMFKAEQQEYTNEGIPWTEIQFKDNQSCIDLIEKPLGGVITLLAEEGRVPKGSDKGFIGRLTKQYAKHKYFDYNAKNPMFFDVKHFAGQVTYDAEGFLEKNKDALTLDVIKAIKASEINLVKALLADEGEDEEGGGKDASTAKTADSDAPGGGLVNRARRTTWSPNAFKQKPPNASPPPAAGGRSRAESTSGGGRVKPTVTMKFKDDLTKLVTTLASSERHYVRCIKPNDEKSPTGFTSEKVMSQLACNGVFETITLRKAGFSNRMVFDRFIDKYFVCLGSLPRDKSGITEFMTNFMPLTEPPHPWAIGTNKVFLRELAIEKLAQKQIEMWQEKATVLQSFIRQHLAKQEAERRRAVIRIQSSIRSYHAVEKLNKHISARQLQCYVRSYYATLELNKRKSILCLQSYIRRAAATNILAKHYSARTLQTYIRSYISTNILIRHQSANTIQNHIRGYYSMMQLLKLKEEERNRREKSSLLIQSFVRSFLARQEHDELRERYYSSISKLQNQIRRYNSVSLLLHLRQVKLDSIMNLQSRIRSYNCFEELNHLRAEHLRKLKEEEERRIREEEERKRKEEEEERERKEKKKKEEVEEKKKQEEEKQRRKLEEEKERKLQILEAKFTKKDPTTTPTPTTTTPTTSSTSDDIVQKPSMASSPARSGRMRSSTVSVTSNISNPSTSPAITRGSILPLKDSITTPTSSRSSLTTSSLSLNLSSTSTSSSTPSSPSPSTTSSSTSTTPVTTSAPPSASRARSVTLSSRRAPVLPALKLGSLSNAKETTASPSSARTESTSTSASSSSSASGSSLTSSSSSTSSTSLNLSKLSTSGSSSTSSSSSTTTISSISDLQALISPRRKIRSTNLGSSAAIFADMQTSKSSKYSKDDSILGNRSLSYSSGTLSSYSSSSSSSLSSLSSSSSSLSTSQSTSSTGSSITDRLRRTSVVVASNKSSPSVRASYTSDKTSTPSSVSSRGARITSSTTSSSTSSTSSSSILSPRGERPTLSLSSLSSGRDRSSPLSSSSSTSSSSSSISSLVSPRGLSESAGGRRRTASVSLSSSSRTRGSIK
eukprot:TRINITY_DN1008_c0_g1_i1.p1 TRINITY_DN1008_c0_g1~~TRINITY_DN1008_c0_g1_i1.p1  ORF type:complete len:1521 (-),score=561.84 TRINITY_DN1008_c0_g1_i1:153-4715(-)